MPPTDARYLDATTEDILTDHWANWYFEHPTTEEFTDEDFDLAAIVKSMDDGDWEEVK